MPADTPRSIRELLGRCLDRSVKNRLRDIGEARVAIAKALAEPESKPTPSAKASFPWLPWAVAAIFGIASALAFWSAHANGTAALPVERFSIDLPDANPAIFGASPALAISPDGSVLAYV